jgi:hypothetical protein
MKPDFSADELARLLDRPRSELLALRDAGLIDLDGDDCFDDLDLVRAQVLRDYLDQGYSPVDLANAIRDGTVSPFLGELLFAAGPTYSIEEAAAKGRGRRRATEATPDRSGPHARRSL